MHYSKFHILFLFLLQLFDLEINRLSEPSLETMLGLVTPFAGVQNLDVSPDASSNASGNRNFWGLPTPSDGPFITSSSSDTEVASIRAYQSEGDM